MGVRPLASMAACSWPKSLKAQRMTICFSPFSPVPSPISSRPWSMSSSSSASRSSPSGCEPEHAHALEQEGDAAGGAQVAAVLLEVHAHVGDGAHDVVGGGLHQHRDAVRRVALVEDDLVVGRRLAAGALDGGLDLVLGHVRGAGVLERAAQRRVGVGVGPAGLHRDGDVLADAREQLRHLVPAGEHRGLACLEDASHGRDV